MRMRLIAAVTAVVLSGPAAAEDLITAPIWAERPTAEILSLFYRGKAATPLTPGSATVECVARPDGRLEKCQAISEAPVGRLFGKQAESAGRLYRLPAGAAGRRVRFTIDFAPPSFDTPPKQMSGLSLASLAAVWPTAANGGEGTALITCLVTVQAVVRDCRVLAEDPPGKGFGAAAIQIAPNVAYKPATKSGAPVDGRMLLRVAWKGEGPTGPGERIMTNFWWDAAPSAAQIDAAYPKAALRKGVEGNAVMRCELTLEGSLKRCKTVSERPQGYDFGDAALKLAPLFKSVPLDSVMDPKLIPTVRLDVPVHFAPPAPSAQPRRLTSVKWTRQPDPEAVYEAYPAKAADAGVDTGRAMVDCAIGSHGQLSDCKVVSEQPDALGFGAAATAVAQMMAVNPWTEDGAPAEGARLTLPIRFVHKEPEPATRP